MKFCRKRLSHRRCPEWLCLHTLHHLPHRVAAMFRPWPFSAFHMTSECYQSDKTKSSSRNSPPCIHMPTNVYDDFHKAFNIQKSPLQEKNRIYTRQGGYGIERAMGAGCSHFFIIGGLLIAGYGIPKLVFIHSR